MLEEIRRAAQAASSGPYPYDPADFGADELSVAENWKGSGYTHYTAYSRNGGQVSWNEIEEANGRYVEDIHVSSKNDPRGRQ